MLQIPYEAVKFPSRFGERLATGLHMLPLTWAELVHAAITVGRRSWADVLAHGSASVYEIVARSAGLYAHLYEQAGNTHGSIGQSAAYQALDPSEKSSVSYSLGLTLAKLFAGRLLGAPWLMHLDVYADQLGPAATSGQRPDLVGLSADLVKPSIIVIECKGRSNALDRDAKETAKLQTWSLAEVGGEVPGLRVGLVGYFHGRDRALRAYIEDPAPPDVAVTARLPSLTPAQLVLDSYRPVFDLLESGYGQAERVRAGNQREYLVKTVQEADLSVGLDVELHAALERVFGGDAGQEARRDLLGVALKIANLPYYDYEDERLAALPLFRREREDAGPRAVDESIRIGRDGVYVELGAKWRNGAMSNPVPWRRG